uniref:Uncharacterized protein n=1 Tax=Fagus sylvatica TaxID=28930 RepID=A0A2N9HTH3_FAGSY
MATTHPHGTRTHGNEACPKCSPLDRASERARGRGVAMERGSSDGERELRRRKREGGGAMQRELRPRELGERKS